jgi:PAS domain S-box-containing protein
MKDASRREPSDRSDPVDRSGTGVHDEAAPPASGGGSFDRAARLARGLYTARFGIVSVRPKDAADASAAPRIVARAGDPCDGPTPEAIAEAWARVASRVGGETPVVIDEPAGASTEDADAPSFAAAVSVRGPDGERIGTLGVLGRGSENGPLDSRGEPREGEESRIERLRDLAALVAGDLRRRRAEREARRVRLRSDLQERIHTRIADGDPIGEVLEEIVEAMEARRPDMIGSILLYDADAGVVRHGAAPSLPESYTEAVDGLEVGPAAGSCGTAAYEGEPVVAEDLRTDPRWADHRELAREHDLRACWSTPICASDGSILGTFAMYYRHPKRPSEADRALIGEARTLARLAVERHRTLEALRSSEKRYQTLLDHFPDGAVFLVGPGLECLLAGGTELEALGLDAATVEGSTPHDVLPAAVADEVADRLRRARDGRPQVFERRYDGRHYRVQAVAVPSAQGGASTVTVVAQNVTSLRRSEEALRRERDRLVTLFESLPTPAVYGTMTEGDRLVVSTVNRAFEQVFGREADELEGESLNDHIVPSDRREEAVEIDRSALQERSTEAEVQRLARDGRRDFQVQVAARSRADAEPKAAGSGDAGPGDTGPGEAGSGDAGSGEAGSGEAGPRVAEAYAIYTDITDQKRQERRARQRRQRTEQLYGATHRLLEADDPSDVASEITDLVSDTFGYEGVVVRFVEDGALVPARVTQETRRHMPERPVYGVDDPVAPARALRSGQSVCYDDVQTIDDEVDRGDFRSVAYVPIGDHGIIALGDTTTGVDGFDVQLLEILGGHAAAVLDSIEQRRALRESTRTYRGIIDQARDSIYVLDEEGRFVALNASTAAMLGREADDLLGRSIMEVVDADKTDLSVAREALRGALQGEAQRVELWAERDDGPSFPKDVRLQPVTYFGREAVLGVGRNIAGRKEAEQSLREAKKRAESAARLKTAMLANMSHEVRTPLTNIIGFADLLEQESSGRAERFAGLIRQGGERLMTTLDSVLQLSKLEAGRRAVEAERVDLRAVVGQIVAENREEAQAQGVALRLEAPPGPSGPSGSPGPPVVRGDRGALQSIASNLIDNALKFTGEGGQVRVGLRRAPGGAEALPEGDSPAEALSEGDSPEGDFPEGDSPEGDFPEEGSPGEDAPEEAVVLTVADTGVGMSAEFQARMFEAFRQESDARAGQFEREHEGSGLGLAIVEKLVALHGGAIAVESAPGEGTTIRVRLPAAD